MMASAWHKLRLWLAHPRAPWIAVTLGVVLTLSSLGNGLVLDDLYHRQVLLEGVGYMGRPRPFWELFTFFPDDASLREAARNQGIWPWWMGEVVITFMRPVSSLTHALDYALWPEAPWLMHLHSVIWYGALLTLAAVLYRRLLGRRDAPAEGSHLAVGVATVGYALDAGHGLPVGWLATRNMVVASTFALATLIAHDIHRRETSRAAGLAAWIGPLALAIALCSAEFAVGILGYLVAYALFFERAPGWGRRLLTIAPHLGVVLIWKIAYRALGHGARGTGLYLHPFDDPLAFAGAVMKRWPVLVGSQITLPVADFSASLPETTDLGVAAVMGLIAMTLGVYLFGPLVREDRRARMFAAGALLAAVPSATTFPHTRLLMLAGFGFFGLLALMVERHTDRTIPRGKRIVGGVLVARHFVLAALFLPINAASSRVFGEVADRAAASFPGDEAIAEQTLVVVNAPHAFLVSFGPATRRMNGLPSPARLRTLGTTMDEVRVTRRDAHCLTLETPDGYLGSRAHQAMWDPNDRRDTGFTVALDDLHVEVERATADGRPRVVSFCFDASPANERYRWVTWRCDGFVPFELPEVGESATLPALDLEGVLFGACS